MRRRLFGSMRAAAAGIERDEPRVRRFEAGRGLRVAEERVTCRRVLPGDREAVDDCLDVQAGAADEQRPMAARFDRGDRVPREVLGPHDRPVLVRVGDVDQMVRHGRALGERRLGGSDVHRAVHLHRVERDDLDVTGRGRECERERRLAGRGRTDEREMPAHAGDAVTGIRIRRRRGGADAVDEVAPQPVRCGVGDAHVDELAGGEVAHRPAARRARACCGGCVPTTRPRPSSTGRRAALPRPRRGAPRGGAAPSPRRLRSAAPSARARPPAGTKSSTNVAASVPGRGENTNVYAAS